MAKKKSRIRLFANVLTAALILAVLPFVPSEIGKVSVVISCVAIGLVNYLDGHLEEEA